MKDRAHAYKLTVSLLMSMAVAGMILCPAWADDTTIGTPPADDETASALTGDVMDTVIVAQADSTETDEKASTEAEEVAGEEEPEEEEEPDVRTKLLLIPDEVLDEALSDDFIVEGGPQITSVTGNAANFRKYTFTEPTSPFILDLVRARGTNDEGGWMYDVWMKTPGQRNSADGFEIRDFDGASTARASWDRHAYFTDFGVGAAPSTRDDVNGLLRTRFGSRGWLDVTVARRQVASPAGTSRAVAFTYDDIGLRCNWRFGGTQVTAFADASQYTDTSNRIDFRSRRLAADRTTLRFGLRASSVGYSDLQWHAKVGATQSRYQNLGVGRVSVYSGAADLTWRAKEDLALKAGVTHVNVPQTIVQNTYNPSSTTARVSGIYTGIPKWRTYFGYERRFGTRYSTQPAAGGDQGFTENQTVDRLWLKGRMRSSSDFIIETAVKYRRLRGATTTYLNDDPTVAPALLYPNKTTFDIAASYPTGAGLIRGGFVLGNYSNGARNSSLRTYGVTGHWSKLWSENWTTTAQFDRTWYDATNSGAAGLDTTLTSYVFSADWGIRRGSVSGAFGLFDSTGGYRARQRMLGLSVNYEASDDTKLSLGYENQRETLTGLSAYNAHVVMLRASHDF